MVGYLLILLVFGLLGGWAAFAKLDRAVVAPAVIAVESNRKIILTAELSAFISEA
jgi:hypothetical protein